MSSSSLDKRALFGSHDFTGQPLLGESEFRSGAISSPHVSLRIEHLMLAPQTSRHVYTKKEQACRSRILKDFISHLLLHASSQSGGTMDGIGHAPVRKWIHDA